MPIQISLIGLGRTGTSIGLALKRKADSAGLRLVGHDSSLEMAKRAQALGAIDAAEWNLPAAVEKADAIYVCVPLSELRKTLDDVMPYVRAGCVITDTAPLKLPVIEWAAGLVPEDRYYIGGYPIPNPAFLHEAATGHEAARADLFDGGLWALVPDANASPEALKLINDLSRLIGATPFFVGAMEFDGLMAGIGTLPALAATALLRVVAGGAGWADGRKLADRTFATATAPASYTGPGALRAAALLNQVSVLHLLDALLNELGALRQAIAAGDPAAIEKAAAQAAEARESWLAQRKQSNWEADELPKRDIPTPAGMLKQLVGIGRWGEIKKKKE
jgi:prephenate dehydrogenase